MYFEPHRPETMGYVVEGVEAEASGAAAEVEAPIATFLATASAERGANQFKKCAACHTITPGGANGIGPNLHAIVNKPHGHLPNFSYSSALKGVPGVWDFESLSHWLKSPKAYAPGNKMAFAGISKPQDRADVIAYLNSQGSNVPFPPPPAANAAEAEAPAAGKAPDQPAGDAAAVAAAPEGNLGGPGAPAVTGTSKTDH
jgi:cytochrome c